MKISRLEVEKFAGEESPTITKKDVAGNDLVIQGGNRSGKTLTFNAILYGLYGRNATFGVSPGRSSNIQFAFDNADKLSRGGGGREYSHQGKTHRKDAADEKIREFIGPEEIVTLQFIHSETSELPLSSLSKKDRVSVIRRVVASEAQQKIEELDERREELEDRIEQVERLDLWPRKDDLDEIDIERQERRLEKVEDLQSLIDSGRMESIRDSLLEDERTREQLEKLDNRRRVIQKELRKKNRKLSDARRYTDEVDSLILDAIRELTCPVCDHVVRDSLADRRLKRNQCPQCGQERSISELKEDLQSKVDVADDTIEELEAEIEELESEKAEIEEEIEDLQSSVPDLSDLSDLAIGTLKSNDYDLANVEAQTAQELDLLREHIEELREQKRQLDEEISEVEEEIDDLNQDLENTVEHREALSQNSFDEEIEAFREAWSNNYREMAPSLAAEIDLQPDGTVIVPGTDGRREYNKLSTGERRLLNLAFAITIAEEANANEHENHNWECLVLDEPFTNIDEEIRDETIEFLQASNLQLILTTSNEDVVDHFEPRQIKELDRIDIQSTFAELEELMADD